MTGTMAILMAAALVSPAVAQEVGKIDYVDSKDAADRLGQKVLSIGKAQAQLLARFDVHQVEITAETRFVAEVEALSTGSESFSLRVVPLFGVNGKLAGFSGGINKQATSAGLKTYTGEFSLPGDPNYNPEGGKISTFLLLAVRYKPKGDLWVKSVKLSVGVLRTDDLLLNLKKSLTESGYQLEEKGGGMTATKPTERKYYSLRLKEEYPNELTFLEAAYQGTTYVSKGYQPPLFPLGPYIYGTADELKARAEARGMSFEELLEAQAKDVADHGGNTIYYANLATHPEAFIPAVTAARKHGVFVFAQLGGKLYLRPEKGEEYYESVTKPAAEAVLSQYKGLEGVLGWMGKEEATPEQVPLMIRYRKLCKELDPTHALFTLHNRIESFRADTDAFPEWYGFDRYRFKVVEPKTVISTPREVVNLLSNEMSGCYWEAAKRGRPLICVSQSWTYLSQKLVKAMEPRSGYREVRPGVWQGWQRYLPEHAMHLQTWLGISEGSKGSLWYHYYGASEGRGTGMGRLLREECLVDEMGRETRYWKELSQCFREIRKLTPLFLSWHREVRPFGTADSPWVKTSSFIREFDRERYHVLLNTRIAEWDKTSPSRPNNQTQLYFDETGLAGFDKVGDLEFTFKSDGAEPLWDILSGRKLTRNDDGSYAMKLPPGRGAVLLQGSEEDFNACVARLGLSK